MTARYQTYVIREKYNSVTVNRHCHITQCKKWKPLKQEEKGCLCMSKKQIQSVKSRANNCIMIPWLEFHSKVRVTCLAALAAVSLGVVRLFGGRRDDDLVNNYVQSALAFNVYVTSRNLSTLTVVYFRKFHFALFFLCFVSAFFALRSTGPVPIRRVQVHIQGQLHIYHRNTIYSKCTYICTFRTL